MYIVFKTDYNGTAIKGYYYNQNHLPRVPNTGEYVVLYGKQYEVRYLETNVDKKTVTVIIKEL